MEFEYFYVQTCSDVIDIDSIANCYIEAFNDLGARFYLWIKTDDGYTKILQAGPYVDNGVIPAKSCSILYDNFMFTDSKVRKRIQAYLNNPSYMITQAFDRQNEYSEEEKFSKLYNLIKYMEGNN